ncbi:hypothetical protein Tco_1442884 [Tanacetum coccineum]
MDDPNITMKEYIRLEEEKARRHGKVFNWETAKYGKIWDDEDVHDLRSVETEFPAIVFNDAISFDESDDEDYTVIYDKNSFFFKIISVDNLKTDSKNDNDKVNMPLFPSPEPTVSCLNDLDFFKDFENEFPTIVYNDALTSKSDFLTGPTVSLQHIVEFNLKNETSLSECDEEEQNILYFNNLFPYNIIYPDDSKSDKDNDYHEIDIKQSSEVLARRQTRMYFQFFIESVFPDCLYGVSKPHGYGVLSFWTLSSLYFQHGLYGIFVKRIQRIRHKYQYDVSCGMDTGYRLPVQF